MKSFSSSGSFTLLQSNKQTIKNSIASRNKVEQNIAFQTVPLNSNAILHTINDTSNSIWRLSIFSNMLAIELISRCPIMPHNPPDLSPFNFMSRAIPTITEIREIFIYMRNALIRVPIKIRSRLFLYSFVVT